MHGSQDRTGNAHQRRKKHTGLKCNVAGNNIQRAYGSLQRTELPTYDPMSFLRWTQSTCILSAALTSSDNLTRNCAFQPSRGVEFEGSILFHYHQRTVHKLSRKTVSPMTTYFVLISEIYGCAAALNQANAIQLRLLHSDTMWPGLTQCKLSAFSSYFEMCSTPKYWSNRFVLLTSGHQVEQMTRIVRWTA